MRRRDVRKQEVARIWEEGRQAYRDGKHIQQVPRVYIGTVNRYRWEQGYREARDASLDTPLCIC